MKPTVLVIGGTGQVGIHVLARMIKTGRNCLAPSRSVVSGPVRRFTDSGSIIWCHPEALTADSFNSDFDVDRSCVETMISAGPIALAVEWLEIFPALKTLICLSSSSVYTKSDSPVADEREQISQILRDEKRLQTACDARQIRLVILQPTLIFGCGMDANISRMAKFISRFGFLPLAGKAAGLRQPVHVADLADFMEDISRSDLPDFLVSPVCGGSTISYRDMSVRIFEALGRTVRIISLPNGMLVSLTRLVAMLPGLKGLNAAMIQRQNRDLVFDDSELRRRFEFNPRPFEPALTDFELPAELARLLPT